MPRYCGGASQTVAVEPIAVPAADLACRCDCAPRSGITGTGVSSAVAKGSGPGSKVAARSGVLTVGGGVAESEANAADTSGPVGGDVQADSLAITFGGEAKSKADAAFAGTGPGAAKAQSLAGSGPGGKAAASVRS